LHPAFPKGVPLKAGCKPALQISQKIPQKAGCKPALQISQEIPQKAGCKPALQLFCSAPQFNGSEFKPPVAGQPGDLRPRHTVAARPA
jgi:hypothetical protein